MPRLSERPITLPPLSDQAAAELLDFLEALYQIVEERYAGQIYRHYISSGIVKSPTTSGADEPF